MAEGHFERFDQPTLVDVPDVEASSPVHLRGRVAHRHGEAHLGHRFDVVVPIADVHHFG